MNSLPPLKGNFSELVDQARSLYAEMDRDYDKAAGTSGFVCNGCEDNCCRSLFYHHTYLEYILLHSGMMDLPKARQQEILERATEYVRSVSINRPIEKQVMCPVNEKGRCILYTVRPMICRLHGIPHEFKPPGHPQRLGPGCKAFYDQCGPLEKHRLDRTPHYMELARLEAAFKRRLGLNQKIKLTVAEMLLRKPTGAIAELLDSPCFRPSEDADDETD